jgi:hypothetical protein
MRPVPLNELLPGDALLTSQCDGFTKASCFSAVTPSWAETNGRSGWLLGQSPLLHGMGHDVAVSVSRTQFSLIALEIRYVPSEA